MVLHTIFCILLFVYILVEDVMFVASKQIQLERMSNSNLRLIIFLSCFFMSFASPSSPSSDTTHKCSAQQTVALFLFKRSLFSTNDLSQQQICQDLPGSRYYSVMNNWNTSIDCCNWNGVTCDDSTGDVISLDLSCGMLQGTIHSNTTLFHLPRLQRLNLGLNDFKLEPHVFTNMLQNYTNLKELSLRNVKISSELTTFLNISSSLKILNLRSTGLQGNLPHYIFNLKSLEELDLSDNMFTGQIPSEISLLPKLVLLDLSNNGLDLQPYILNNLLNNSTLLTDLWLAKVNIGLFLPTYMNFSSSLKSLNLSSTGLHGKLPVNLFNLINVEELTLSENNNLTGPLPKVNTSASISLMWLNLSFVGLSGEIPESIGYLNSLIYLSFSDCGLTGSLPKSLGNLRHLIFLYLSSNKLSGTLPSSLFTLPSLEYIRLGNNMFIGNIPVELFSLQSIKGLSLPRNQLSGQIDVLDHGPISQTFRQLTNLTYIDLSSNHFRGDWDLNTLLSSLTNLEELHLSHSGLSVLSNTAKNYVNPGVKLLSVASCKLNVFPESLRAMKNLKTLDLSNNDIHGHIPEWVGEIGGNRLLVLDLSNNSITGTISNVFNNCAGLEGFIVNGNQLEGEVPSSLSNCQNLRILDFGNNHLNDTFPGWLGSLPKLQALVLESNSFHGHIATFSTIEFPFPSLRVLVLSHNEFEGQLPLKYFQNFNAMKNVVKNNTKPEYLLVGRVYYSIVIARKGVEQDFPRLLVEYTIIDLSNNNFESEIPDIIGNLKSLKVLNLSGNSLTGQIPRAIGKLSEIESLDLSRNQLTEEIPQSLADLTFLSSLNLSQNHLVGRIPQGKQFNTFQADSFGSNPKLCGVPLPSKCERPRQPQDEGDGDDVEPDHGLPWKVVMLGYGCGTLAGLVLGYLMLSTGRPKWFNAIADAAEHMILWMQTKRR